MCSPLSKEFSRGACQVCVSEIMVRKGDWGFILTEKNMCTCSEIDLHASTSFRTLCRFHFMRLFLAFLENDAVWDQSRRVTSAGYPTDLLGSLMCSVLKTTKHDVPVSKTTSITKPFGFVPYLRGISYNLKKTGIKYGTSDERSSQKSWMFINSSVNAKYSLLKVPWESLTVFPYLVGAFTFDRRAAAWTLGGRNMHLTWRWFRLAILASPSGIVNALPCLEVPRFYLNKMEK